MSAWRKVGGIAVACVLASLVGHAQEQKVTGRQGESRLDVEYGVVLEQGEKRSEVALLRELKTGDRFHFRLRPKQAANAYLFVANDKGAFDLVLPDEKDKARSSDIGRNQWSTLPDQDWLRFDKARGIEHMYLFMSAAPIEDVEELFANGKKPEAVDETWLIDLRNKLDAEGSTTFIRGADVVRMTHRRKTNAPAAIVEEFNVRHK